MDEVKKEEVPQQDKGNGESKDGIHTILSIGRTPDGAIAIQGELNNTELCLGALEMAKMELINFSIRQRQLRQQQQNKKIVHPSFGTGLFNRGGRRRH